MENTEHLNHPELDSDVVNPREKTTQLVRKSSASPPTRGQPHQPPSSPDVHALHGASPFQKATPEELDHPPSQQIACEQNLSLNGLPSRPTSASGRSRRVPEEDDDGEGSTEHHAKLVAPDAPSGKEIARSEHGRLIQLERQLSETLVAKTEQNRHIAQLTDELAVKSALLEQTEVKLALKSALHGQAEAKLALKSTLLEQAEGKLALKSTLLEQAEANAAEEKKRAGLELRELQARLDESLLSRNHALEQAQSALQKASCAAEANEQSKRELTEMRAELEASKSESAAFRLQLADMENGCSKSKAKEDGYRTPTATDEDRAVHRLMERMQAMEAEMLSLRWNEKSFERMECRNEG